MADPLAPDDNDLRAELRRATSTLPGGGADFADLTRRVRRRRASQAALRGGIPALCVVLMGGGLWALTRGGPDADRPAAPSTSIDGPFTTPTVPSPSTPASSPTTGVATTAPLIVTTGPGETPPTTSPPSTVAVTPLPATTEPSVVATSTSSAPVKTLLLDLGLTGGAVNLVSVTDGSTVYVWSAADGKGLALDPVTLESRPIAPMPLVAAPRTEGAWTWAGGRAFVRSDTSYALYDPTSDSWTPGALPEPRAGLAVTVWTGTHVMIWGGTVTLDGTGETPLDGLLLEPGTRVWTRTSEAPSARIGEVSAALASGLVAVAGDAVGSFDTAPLLLYRPSDDTWSEVAPPIALPWTPFVAARGDRFTVIGLNHSASAEYDPGTGEWTTALPTAPNNPGRHAHLAVTDGERLMYLPGGGMVTVFDGDSWRPPAAVAGSFDAVWAGGRLVVFGSNSNDIADGMAMVSSLAGDQLVGQ